eukprot:6203993-Pleurochrysis_carterae.AAC.6
MGLLVREEVGIKPGKVDSCMGRGDDSQNKRYSAILAMYCPIRGWESGDSMVPLTHCPSKNPNNYLQYVTSTWSLRCNWPHVNHSCQSIASDRVARDIPYIPPSAYIAAHAYR